MCRLKPSMVDASEDERRTVQLKQGRSVFGVEMKIVDEDGTELPHDGEAFGELKVRGPWICSSYFKLDESDAHDEAAGSQPATSSRSTLTATSTSPTAAKT